MREAERQSRALAAASQAAAAVPALLEYAANGASHPGPFGSEEVVELLADALKMTLEVECAENGDCIDSDRNQLLGACTRYLEGWVG